MGLYHVFAEHPCFIPHAMVCIGIAISIEISLELFMTFVVEPVLLASVVGSVASFLALCIEQALQPVINDIVFFCFDDQFLYATLETTGIKDKLERKYKCELQPMGMCEKSINRYLVKCIACVFVSLAGLSTAVPLVGHIFTALAAGSVVMWDYVFTALPVIVGSHSFCDQLKTFFSKWCAYQWNGFFALLLEEVPFVSPFFHVWNIYSAALFLENVYCDDDDSGYLRLDDSDDKDRSAKLGGF